MTAFAGEATLHDLTATICGRTLADNSLPWTTPMMMRVAGIWLASLALWGLATPAIAVQTANGAQIIEDFEGRPLGPAAINFCDITDPFENCLGVLSGGSITAATGAFPAASGNQVYVGTSISLVIANAVDFSWPAVAARVSGTAPIRLRIWDFDPGTGQDDLIFDVTTAGGDMNTLLGHGSELAPLFLTRLEFSSTADFAMDNLAMGLPTIGPGIPEPASWALLITGLGLVGAMVRRRAARLQGACHA